MSFLQYDSGNEGPGQVGDDGQDSCFLPWHSSDSGGHIAGGQ